MIYLTRLSRSRVVVNSDLIQHIEGTPDTVISLTSGEKILVLESADEIIARIVAFRRLIFENLPLSATSNDHKLQNSQGLAQAESASLPRS